MLAEPRVPTGRRVYAIGDIHGRADLLERLLERIDADAARSGATDRVIVYLGDYVDRGPASTLVLETVLAGRPGFATVPLLGNHERLMLDALDEAPGAIEQWLRNGAAATFRSYGIDVETEIDPTRALRRRLSPAHRRLLDGLRLSHLEGDYLFVHAGVDPGRPWDGQRPDDLIWIRDQFLESDVDFGKIVVHGHTISPLVVEKPNRIGIDTGAYFSGCLTALVLEGGARRFLQTRGE